MDVQAAFEAWGSYDLDDPFPLFSAVRELGAVHPVTLADGHDAWVVVGYDAARAALNDPGLSKNMQAAMAAGIVAEGLPGPALARHMLAVDPPDHTRLRKLVSATFSRRRIDGLRPTVQRIVDDLLDGVQATGASSEVDLIASFAFPFPFTVICELLGVPDDDRDRLGSALRTLLVPTATADAYSRARQASDEVVAMLEGMIAAKREAPGDDLVSGLVTARDGDERLSEQELASTIFQLIVAGHDTTTNLIGNGTVALLSHPDQLVALRDHPERIPDAVEELLRYDPPGHHATFRYATEPVELDGVTIPAGAQVIVSLAAADRDAARFDHPDTLDLDRREHHLAFGHGIHYCLGAPLARMEGHVAFAALLARFPHLRLAVDVGELHWSHGDGLVLRGLSRLPVIPGPAALAGRQAARG